MAAFDLAERLAQTPAGGALAVPAGTYSVNLTLERPVRLVAMGQVVLDGLRRGSVLTVACEGEVALSGFFIVGGEAPDGGAGVNVQSGQVQLSDCVFRHNASPLNGGGALLVAGNSKVVATRCRFEANKGRQGGAVLVDEEATLELSDSLLAQNGAVLGGAVRLKEGARATLTGCTLADNKVVGELAGGGAVSLSGTSTRAPSLELRQCVLSERQRGPTLVHNGPTFPGELKLDHCLLPSWAQDLKLPGDVLYGEAAFEMIGAEPYQLSAGSPGVGQGRFSAGAKDLLGLPREAPAALCLGAYASAGKSSMF